MVCMIVPSCRIVILKNHFEHLNIEQSILLFVALTLVANVLCYSALNII